MVLFEEGIQTDAKSLVDCACDPVEETIETLILSEKQILPREKKIKEDKLQVQTVTNEFLSFYEEEDPSTPTVPHTVEIIEMKTEKKTLKDKSVGKDVTFIDRSSDSIFKEVLEEEKIISLKSKVPKAGKVETNDSGIQTVDVVVETKHRDIQISPISFNVQCDFQPDMEFASSQTEMKETENEIMTVTRSLISSSVDYSVVLVEEGIQTETIPVKSLVDCACDPLEEILPSTEKQILLKGKKLTEEKTTVDKETETLIELVKTSEFGIQAIFIEEKKSTASQCEKLMVTSTGNEESSKMLLHKGTESSIVQLNQAGCQCAVDLKNAFSQSKIVKTSSSLSQISPVCFEFGAQTVFVEEKSVVVRMDASSQCVQEIINSECDPINIIEQPTRQSVASAASILLSINDKETMPISIVKSNQYTEYHVPKDNMSTQVTSTNMDQGIQSETVKTTHKPTDVIHSVLSSNEHNWRELETVSTMTQTQDDFDQVSIVSSTYDLLEQLEIELVTPTSTQQTSTKPRTHDVAISVEIIQEKVQTPIVPRETTDSAVQTVDAIAEKTNLNSISTSVDYSMVLFEEGIQTEAKSLVDCACDPVEEIIEMLISSEKQMLARQKKVKEDKSIVTNESLSFYEEDEEVPATPTVPHTLEIIEMKTEKKTLKDKSVGEDVSFIDRSSDSIFKEEVLEEEKIIELTSKVPKAGKVETNDSSSQTKSKNTENKSSSLTTSLISSGVDYSMVLFEEGIQTDAKSLVDCACDPVEETIKTSLISSEKQILPREKKVKDNLHQKVDSGCDPIETMELDEISIQKQQQQIKMSRFTETADFGITTKIDFLMEDKQSMFVVKEEEMLSLSLEHVQTQTDLESQLNLVDQSTEFSMKQDTVKTQVIQQNEHQDTQTSAIVGVNQSVQYNATPSMKMSSSSSLLTQTEDKLIIEAEKEAVAQETNKKLSKKMEKVLETKEIGINVVDFHIPFTSEAILVESGSDPIEIMEMEEISLQSKQQQQQRKLSRSKDIGLTTKIDFLTEDKQIMTETVTQTSFATVETQMILQEENKNTQTSTITKVNQFVEVLEISQQKSSTSTQTLEEEEEEEDEAEILKTAESKSQGCQCVTIETVSTSTETLLDIVEQFECCTEVEVNLVDSFSNTTTITKSSRECQTELDSSSKHQSTQMIVTLSNASVEMSPTTMDAFAQGESKPKLIPTGSEFVEVMKHDVNNQINESETTSSSRQQSIEMISNLSMNVIDSLDVGLSVLAETTTTTTTTTTVAIGQDYETTFTHRAAQYKHEETKKEITDCLQHHTIDSRDRQTEIELIDSKINKSIQNVNNTTESSTIVNSLSFQDNPTEEEEIIVSLKSKLQKSKENKTETFCQCEPIETKDNANDSSELLWICVEENHDDQEIQFNFQSQQETVAVQMDKLITVEQTCQYDEFVALLQKEDQDCQTEMETTQEDEGVNHVPSCTSISTSTIAHRERTEETQTQSSNSFINNNLVCGTTTFNQLEHKQTQMEKNVEEKEKQTTSINNKTKATTMETQTESLKISQHWESISVTEFDVACENVIRMEDRGMVTSSTDIRKRDRHSQTLKALVYDEMVDHKPLTHAEAIQTTYDTLMVTDTFSPLRMSPFPSPFMTTSPTMSLSMGLSGFYGGMLSNTIVRSTQTENFMVDNKVQSSLYESEQINSGRRPAEDVEVKETAVQTSGHKELIQYLLDSLGLIRLQAALRDHVNLEEADAQTDGMFNISTKDTKTQYQGKQTTNKSVSTVDSMPLTRVSTVLEEDEISRSRTRPSSVASSDRNSSINSTRPPHKNKKIQRGISAWMNSDVGLDPITPSFIPSSNYNRDDHQHHGGQDHDDSMHCLATQTDFYGPVVYVGERFRRLEVTDPKACGPRDPIYINVLQGVRLREVLLHCVYRSSNEIGSGPHICPEEAIFNHQLVTKYVDEVSREEISIEKALENGLITRSPNEDDHLLAWNVKQEASYEMLEVINDLTGQRYSPQSAHLEGILDFQTGLYVKQSGLIRETITLSEAIRQNFVQVRELESTQVPQRLPTISIDTAF